MFDFLTLPHWAGVAAILAFGSLIVAVLKRQKTEDADPPKPSRAQQALSAFSDRFLSIFTSHDVELPKIPKYLRQLNFVDLTNNERLAAVLTPELIETICSRFNIQQDWLEGKDVPIYFRHFFYQHLRGYIDFLTTLKTKHQHINGYAIKSHEDKLKKDGPDLPIVMLFEASIDGWEQSNGEPVWSYYIIGEEYYWGYWKARYHLKAMTYIAYSFGIFTAGCQMEKDDIKRLIAGRAFPGPLLKDLLHVAWRPMDYIFTKGVGDAVDDHGEAMEVQEKMGHDLHHYLKERVAAVNALSCPLSTSPPSR